MIQKVWNRIHHRIAPLFLGRHPHNTCLSFNWHTVRHVVCFMLRQRDLLGSQKRRFVDVGGGASPYHQFFRNAATSFTCVDVAFSADSNPTGEISQLIGTAENMPLQDGSMDVALCNQVLEHVQDPVKACAEIHRVLATDGWFIGSVPHLSPVHLEPWDFRRFTDLGLRQLLENQGFRDIQIEGNGAVFSSAAFLISMDLMLSRRKQGHPQQFYSTRALLLSPLVGALNLTGWLLDRLLGDSGRSPANLCWTARR
jgi:SAM-dependent methyltransferase